METGKVIFTVGMPGVVLKKRERLAVLDYPKKTWRGDWDERLMDVAFAAREVF